MTHVVRQQVLLVQRPSAVLVAVRQPQVRLVAAVGGTPAIKGYATETTLADAVTALDAVLAQLQGVQAVSASSLPLPTGAATESTLGTVVTGLAAIYNKLATTLTVNTGLQQPTRPTDTQPVSAANLPLPTGASTEATLASILTKLGTTLAVSGAYNPSTHTGTLIAAGSGAATTWNVAPVGGDLGTYKLTPITITIPAGGQMFAAGEVLLLQIGINTGSVPAPTLGTANWTHTLRLGDPTNPTRINFVTGMRTVCPIAGRGAGVGLAAGASGTVKPSVAAASGVGVAAGGLQGIGDMRGTSSGVGTAAGVGSAVAQGAGSATGVGVAAGRVAAVVGTVGMSSAGGGTTTVVRRATLIFDD